MKTWWILSRLMLKNLISGMNPFAASAGRKQNALQKGARKTGRALLLILALASIVYFEYLVYSALSGMGQPMLLPGLAILVAILSTLLLGLFQGISELYQGKDAPWLAVLPATSRQVFAARMVTLYFSELLLNAVIMVPAFVLYMIGTGAWWPCALTGLAVLLLTPMLPLALVALAASLLMRISAFARHRDAITMALSILFALAYSIGVTLINANNNLDDPANSALIMRLAAEDGLVHMALSAFPPARWAVQGFIGNVPQLLLFAAVSAAALAVVTWLMGPGYLDLALAQGEHADQPVRSGAVRWQSGSAFAALTRLEWRELVRTPAWASNGLMGLLMFPLMIAVGFIAGSSSAGSMEEVVEAIRITIDQVDAGYVMAIIGGALSFGCMVNPAVGTAISREGSRYPFAMSLPVSQRKRFMAKLTVGVGINVACSLLVGAVVTVLLRLPLPLVAGGLVISLLIGAATGCAGLAIDAMHPVLKWMNEIQAIKSNINSFLGMLVWFVLLALCALPCWLLWERGGLAVYLGCLGTALLEAAVCWLWLMYEARQSAWLPEEI